MTYVVVFGVVVAVAGLVVLGVLAVRLFRVVRALGRTVAAAGGRIGEAAAGLDAVVPASGRDRAGHGG